MINNNYWSFNVTPQDVVDFIITIGKNAVELKED